MQESGKGVGLINLSKFRRKIGAFEIAMLRREVGCIDNLIDDNGRQVMDCMIGACEFDEFKRRFMKILNDCWEER